jgi:uncharacterized damage-inducible protein DinB
MRTHRCTVLAPAVLLCAAAPALAQAPPDFLAEFDGQFNASASKLVALAKAVPAESYGWAPMEGVAPVAEVYMHIARYNYFYPETAMGVESPMGRAEYDRWEDEVRDKDRVVEILSESMEHVRRVAAGMSAEDLNRMTRLYGRDVGHWAVLLQLVTHMNEHLGQSIAYARMNQVVPPWSR